MALVVIEGYDGVIPPLQSLVKDGISSDGTGQVNPLLPGPSYGRYDRIDFLRAEEAVLPGMGIQSGNGQPWFFYAQRLQYLPALTGKGQDAFLRNLFTSLAQGKVAGQEDYAKPLQLLAKQISFIDPFSGILRSFTSQLTLSI